LTVQAIIALGSNIPPREAALRAAIESMGRLEHTEVIRCSRLYETEPVGGPPQGVYFNAAALIETSLTPGELLDSLLRIEKKQGRHRTVQNGPRTIDLDIIFYGESIIDEPSLVIPHARFAERGFVLQPLADIIPRFIDPRSKGKVSDLLEAWIRSGGEPVEGREFHGPPCVD